MQCDEGCDEDAGWRMTRGAWQWHALRALGVATFVAAIALFVFVLLRRPWPALKSPCRRTATLVALFADD
jgi:hypothetical protein